MMYLPGVSNVVRGSTFSSSSSSSSVSSSSDASGSRFDTGGILSLFYFASLRLN